LQTTLAGKTLLLSTLVVKPISSTHSLKSDEVVSWAARDIGFIFSALWDKVFTP